MNKRVAIFPIRNFKKLKNIMGPGSVPCEVSEMWIQFPQESVGHFCGGELMLVSVMENGRNEKPKKVCELVVSRENLLKALDSVAAPTNQN